MFRELQGPEGYGGRHEMWVTGSGTVSMNPAQERGRSVAGRAHQVAARGTQGNIIWQGTAEGSDGSKGKERAGGRRAQGRRVSWRC